MTEEGRQHRVDRFIDGARHDLSKFAQDSYGMHGRGLTHVSIEASEQGQPWLTDVVYDTLADVRKLLAADKRKGPDADLLLYMIETYDPMRQAVVSVNWASGHPTTVMMRLEGPFLSGETDGVN